MNPMYFLQLISQGGNPQQMMLNIMQEQMQGSPMGENLLALAKENKTAEIEQIARSIAKQKGVDFDKEFNSFKHMLGIK